MVVGGGTATREVRGQRAARLQARFDRPLLVAALLVIPALIIEEGRLPSPWPVVGTVLNWVIWLAFFAEAAVMLAVVPDRWRWIRSHPLDVAIVILTPPFMPAAVQSLRVFRLLRLLRLLKAVQLSRHLFSINGVRWTAVLAAATIVAGGAAFALVERGQQQLSSWDGLWWALTTVTTVGYGDYAPETSAGRVIALLVMVVGIGFVALLTAAAAERFVNATVEERDRDDEIIRRLEELARRLDALEESGGRNRSDARREDSTTD